MPLSAISISTAHPSERVAQYLKEDQRHRTLPTSSSSAHLTESYSDRHEFFRPQSSSGTVAGSESGESAWVSAGSKATSVSGTCRALGAMEALRAVEEMEKRVAEAERRCAEAEEVAEGAEETKKAAVAAALQEARGAAATERRELLEQLCEGQTERIATQARILDIESERTTHLLRHLESEEAASRIEIERCEERLFWESERRHLQTSSSVLRTERFAHSRSVVDAIEHEAEGRKEIEVAAMHGLMVATRCAFTGFAYLASAQMSQGVSIKKELQELQRGSAMLHVHTQLAERQAILLQKVQYVKDTESVRRLALTYDFMSGLVDMQREEVAGRGCGCGVAAQTQTSVRHSSHAYLSHLPHPAPPNVMCSRQPEPAYVATMLGRKDVPEVAVAAKRVQPVFVPQVSQVQMPPTLSTPHTYQPLSSAAAWKGY